VRLSPIVGSNGRIIAEDVVPEYLQGLRKRVRDLGLQNVTVTLGEPHDPKLPTGSVDVAILVHMYHEVTQPYGLLYNLIPALKPNARVGIVDAFAPTSKHGTPPSLLRCELAAVGYRKVRREPLGSACRCGLCGGAVRYESCDGLPEIGNRSLATGSNGLRFQPIDATHWAKRSAGVSKPSVCRGRSFSRRAMLLSLFW